ncbi:hypothetical protein F4780DRAFT_325527 [Xylariomycetidae sp. FL0641]|nr:hypothetical protein F4780DRAFT_325527 [Xylariomycetidae sp. FL0641]
MMTGQMLTVTVPSAVESNQTLHELSSQSVSGLQQFSSPVATRSASRARSLSTKSLPSLPAIDVSSFDFGSENLDASLSFSSDLLRPSTSANEKSAVVSTDQDLGDQKSRTDKMGKRRTMLSRPQSWMPSPRSLPDFGELARSMTKDESAPSKEGISTVYLDPNTLERPRTVSGSLATLAKRSWMPNSRSPSPGDRKKEETSKTSEGDQSAKEGAAGHASIARLKKASRRRTESQAKDEVSRTTEARGKLGNYLTKMKSRPQTVLVKSKVQDDQDSPASSTTSLAPPSTDTRRSHASETSNSTYPEDAPPIPKSTPARDPLWSTFKSLDTDFSKFQNRPTQLKMTLVRTVLVPFLRRYGSHASNKTLGYEDIERRAVILNKWWTGLLDMLNGRTQPVVPGVDRPLLLEAISGLMMRPEWRHSTTSFTPLADRNPRERLRRPSTQPATNQSSSTVDSTDSAYLAESVGHNVRTMFVANLTTQMVIVVEKLCLRHVPFSLINFAGKACAYAFFFAPGIADVLVRLWRLTPDILRRTADEFGLPRRNTGESNDIAALFPPSLESLGWTSPKTLSDSLRRVALPPVATAKIPWHGPWTGRWNGRDSDLFFVFCKYYYILAEEFIPAGLPLVEKARAPGFALVSAQMLSILDSTIHRQAAMEAMSGPHPVDGISGTETSAMTMRPAPVSTNAMKGMAENRLLVLLKNVLSSASVTWTEARHTFAETFMCIMKAAAKRTSQFDHDACFTICDFLEEALPAFDAYVDGQKPGAECIDWPFWLEVCQKMLDTNNSMSEIRVLSLVFAIWDTIAGTPSRKGAVCREWLLTEETFTKLFSNWCPMVRAYYMRLLCWRICRDTGDANETDIEIFSLVFSRLKTIWSHYLWLKQSAEERGIFPPSTAPSFPTPGKRFMIIRTELPTIQPGLMTAGFDSSSGAPQLDSNIGPPTDFESMETPSAPSESSAVDDSSPKKRWSLLGKVLAFTNNNDASNDLEAVRRDTAASRTAPTSPKATTNAGSVPASDTDSMGSAPVFEETRYMFRFLLSWNPAGTIAPPNRILTRPRLPGPAQSCITSIPQAESSPSAAVNRPAPTRAVSGSPSPGLVDAARNADESDVPVSPITSTPLDRCDSNAPSSPTQLISEEFQLWAQVALPQDSITTPVEPKGIHATGVKYSGRALAEWGLVVAECNSFVDRRRDEGVPGLSDVEVPSLGVEGFRKLA